ncbi:nuclear transport factor 2 family protein [Nostoc sp. FACHB-152]|uniref:nuclear transport factor 2 family protein n=1 Tax=unclassified Nostoc TaxID=2593658 RepID=UPI001688D6C1|nr:MULTISPECIES: nuclear transport factor 2 family protein [unclassified Nostoc]MBD2450037.1 nuclear transport factor 2 family protein [Nostoc sp. FACHB-152]MBD2470157.1 nuclear transport factor 2 family protein [Nostoc sp. FACHB-145]
MTNIIAALLKRQPKFATNSWLLLCLLTLGLTSSLHGVQAAPAQNPPADLNNLLTQIDTAASKGNAKAVLQFYSPNFTNGDGLNRPNLEKALVTLWKQYPQLRYSTKLQDWKSEGNAIIATTVTNISSLPSANTNSYALNATITSRQRVTGGKIVRQDILSERTLITSGKQPPQIDMKLPQQVKVGQQYSFDAIVKEPLGDDFLLGTAIEEPVKVEKYLNPSPVELQLLNSGGLFKVGRAPSTPGSHWISAVIVRGEGMAMVTQRLQVVK